MKEFTKDKMPEWCKDKNTNYNLLLSDDIDSFMCYILQKELFNREIRSFIDVNYKRLNKKSFGEQALYSLDKTIGLDIALEKNIKCWDNHVTRYSNNDKYNLNSANINTVFNIGYQNYTDKFVISSFITMLSYYDVDISKWNKEQLAILCAIDGVYVPFCNSRFKNQGRKNLQVLDYEFLANFIEENLEYIIKIENQYNLKHGKIWIDNNGYFNTNIDLLGLQLAFIGVFKTCFSLPNKQFKRIKSYKSAYIDFRNDKYTKDVLNASNRMMNFTLIFKNKGVVSYDVD
ncbi:hypothetical protein JW813_11490 [Clostridium botulinum]|uniref:hypothetical protein n=1 Tax=Clostridium botulinum TaxID=1491 RepID=UPI002247EADC|nr:hypothetical protein [Clostridium botulinum]UZP02339.1 hypothetical protein JW813_11490 [Clostridium botulinum]UZP05698.1 hypothetical protein JYA71_11760 [Clostridium botulinum]UZP09078.1 hypothetical protein JYA74_11485 [Clostridium botulinum]